MIKGITQSMIIAVATYLVSIIGVLSLEQAVFGYLAWLYVLLLGMLSLTVVRLSLTLKQFGMFVGLLLLTTAVLWVGEVTLINAAFNASYAQKYDVFRTLTLPMVLPVSLTLAAASIVSSQDTTAQVSLGRTGYLACVALMAAVVSSNWMTSFIPLSLSDTAAWRLFQDTFGYGILPLFLVSAGLEGILVAWTKMKSHSRKPI